MSRKPVFEKIAKIQRYYVPYSFRRRHLPCMTVLDKITTIRPDLKTSSVDITLLRVCSSLMNCSLKSFFCVSITN